MRSQSLFGQMSAVFIEPDFRIGHVHSVSLSLVVKVSSEEGEEVVHFCLEQLHAKC